MKAVTLIFPHQLFKQHPAVSSERKIFLIEEWLFFHQYKFIKQPEKDCKRRKDSGHSVSC